MITKEEFEKAQQIINEYKEQLNKAFVISRICVCCKTKEIKPLEGEVIKVTQQEQGCWNDGTVEKITFGYGSKHDMRSFYVAICDDCIEQLEKDGLIVDIKSLRKEERKYGL
jgi:hypothetical protein